MTSPSRALLAVALLLGVTACSKDPTFLTDDATCPGSADTCTSDTRARFDALGELDDVTEVVTVSRSYGFDSGSSRSAEVRAGVATPEEARTVALAALRELEAWPEHNSGPVTVSVDSDPPVPFDEVARESLDLGSAMFEPCSPGDCEKAVQDLSARMLAEVDGLEDLTFDRRASTLTITARTDPGNATLAARGIRGAFFDASAGPVGVADRVRIRVTARGPLIYTLRLDDGLVCEQPPGALVTCEKSNSVPFEGA